MKAATSASPLLRRKQVELVQDDDLRQRGETLAVLHELVVDRGVARAAVGQQVVARLHRHDVQQRAGALEVREELVPEAHALGRALEQPGHVRDGQLRAVVRLDRAELRLDGGERVVGHLRARVRDAVEQRRLARVREAEHRRVGEQLQPQLERALLAVEAHLRGARRLARRCRVALVAATSRASARNDDPRAIVGEIGDERAGLDLAHLGADRNLADDVAAAPARLAAALAVTASIGVQVRPEAERAEVAATRRGDQDDVAAIAPVAAVGTALRHELLTAEGHAAVAAAACAYVQGCSVREHRARPGLRAIPPA